MKRIWLACLFLIGLWFAAPAQLVFAQYDNTNTVLGQFDAFGTNVPVFNTSSTYGVPATNGYNFSSVTGSVVFDETRHRLFVADRGNHRVLVYDTNVNNDIPYGSAPTAVLGQPNFTTGTASTSQSGLNGPTALELDEAGGRLFVADTTNGRIMVFDVSGTITNGMNAINYLGGGADFNTVTLASTAYNTLTLNQFNSPQGVAYDSDTNYLYVSDNQKKRITIFDVAAITNGESARSEVLGDSTGNFSLIGPKKMEIDTVNNRLFMTDTGKSRVLIYDIATLVSLEDPVNVLGQTDFLGTISGTTQSKMVSPQDVSYKASTNQLAVSMASRVLIFDVTAITNGENATHVLGKADYTSTATTPITLSITATVDSVEWVGNSQLLALDASRLLSFDVTSITNGEAATNVLGQYAPPGTVMTYSRNANGAIPNSMGFTFPRGVTVDNTNNKLYVSDMFNNRILVFNLDGTTKLPLDNIADNVLGQADFTTNTAPLVASSSNFTPWGTAIDEANQRLFVTDTEGNRVLVFDVSTITNGEAAVNVIGQPDFVTGTSGNGSQKMNDPYFVEYSSTNQWLFVSDGTNRRVLIFDLSGGISNGMAASKVLGQGDFFSAVCSLTSTGMCNAQGQLAFDEDTRNLFVADATHSRVLVYSLPASLASVTNGMSASYVIGQANFTTEINTPLASRLNTTYGLVLTSSNMLLVNDCENNRILSYDVTTLANDPTPLGVIGQANFTTNTLQPVSANTISCSNQQGLAYNDSTQHLYLADSSFNRVVIYDMAKITTASLPDGDTSTSYSQTLTSSQLNSTGTFSVQTGSLPAGLSLNSPDITGTPTTINSYPFTIRLTDNGGSIGSFFTTQDYTVTISGPAPSPTPSPTPTPSPSPSPLVLYDNTSSVLGQFDTYTSTDPIYTTGHRDSIPNTNAYNFDSNLGQIVFDETRDRLFVSDTQNNRILVYQTDSNQTIPYGEPADFVLGQPDFTTDTANTTQSGLSNPQGMALDEVNGRLFVVDQANARVMVFNVSGTITNNMNATNYLGGAGSFNGFNQASNSYETTNLNAFGLPFGAAYDADTNRLYVSDFGKFRVTVFDVTTITNGESALATVLGDASGDFMLNRPSGMDIDTTNNRLFVTQLDYNRVFVYDISTVVHQEDPTAVLGQPDFSTISAGVTQSKMSGPHDVAYRSSDNLLAVGLTGGRVLIYDVAAISNGENAIYVLGQADFTSDNDSITPAFTDNVTGVEWLGTNELLVLDKNRMLSFDVSTITNGEAATNVLGQVDPFGAIKTDTRTADGKFVTEYGLDRPLGVKVDPLNNRLYVAEYNNNRVLVYNLDSSTKLPLDNQADFVLGQTSFATEAAPPSTNDSTFKPWGIEVDPVRNLLFVSDQYANRILVFDVASITNGESAVNVIGQANFSDSAAAATATNLNTPHHLLYNSTDNWLFVGDAYNYRVLVFDLSAGITNGMAASKVIGQPNFTTAGCNLTINGICDVEGQLVFDTANRRLFVADPYGNRILVYTIPTTLAAMTNGMDASFVIGQANFTTDDYTPVETRFNNLYGIALTPSNMLFVQDCYNNRTLAYDVTTLTNDPTPIGVVGQVNFTNVTLIGATSNTMNCSYGQGLDFDATSNRLYLADGGYNRVIGYDFGKISTTSLPSGVTSAAYSQSISSTQLNGTGVISLESGTLPSGVTISSSSITGTPTLAGSFPFSLRLTDDAGTSFGTFFSTQSYTLNITASTPSSTPTPSPDSSPSPSPTPSPVTAGAPNLTSPSSGTSPTNPPAFSWTAPAEPEKVESYTLLVDGKVLFSAIPTTSNLETADYILVYTSSNQSYLLQLKQPLPNGVHSWEVQAVSTTGQTTNSGSSSFTIGISTTSSPTPSPSSGNNLVSSASSLLRTSPKPSASPVGTPEPVDLREQAIQILGAAVSLRETLTQALTQLKPVAPFTPAAAAVVATAATASFIALQVGTQIFNPKVLLELLRSLGLLAQKQPQGMIFDAATFTPIPFALITLTNNDKTVTETVVTDMYGVYRGVKLPIGEYQLTAAHQEYSFPSTRRRPSYFGSKDFYQGENFTVNSEKYQQLFLIPMDDILQRKRRRSFKASISHFFGHVLHHQTKITVLIFGLSLVMTFLAPTLLNLILTSFYGLLMAKKLIPLLARPLVAGNISGPQGKPLTGVVVRFADVSSNELKALAQTDDKGSFKAFIDKGTYQVAATKLGYLWQEASMSLNQMSFTKPTKMQLKMQKAEGISLF